MELTVEEKYLLLREKLYRLAGRVDPIDRVEVWAGGPICDELERMLEIARSLPQ